MSMVIANNMQAVNTKRQFATSSRGMSSAMEKLSSGYKINTGKDDPSGLLISEKLRSQINGLKRAQQNTEEAINVMGIAEGALNEMNSILKKMKALAIHSNNTGVTSPDQVAADQSEMDSAIQTLDRIAQTTKFSDQNLLNGHKDIAFNQDTLIKGTQNNKLLNARESNFSQIYKRDDYAVSISFTGTQNADATTGIGNVDFSQQAMKAYVEVDTGRTGVDGNANMTQISDGAFTQEQAFTLTGSKGSRSFKFKKGETVSTMVSQIKSAADSTGIDASLVFNSDQRIDKMTQDGVVPIAGNINKSIALNGVKDANGRTISLDFSTTQANWDLLETELDGRKLEYEIRLDSVVQDANVYHIMAKLDGVDIGAIASVTGGSTGTNAVTTLGNAAIAGTEIENMISNMSLSGVIDPVATEKARFNYITTAIPANGAISVDEIYNNSSGDGLAELNNVTLDFNELKDSELRDLIAALGAGDTWNVQLEVAGTDEGAMHFIVSLESSGGTILGKTIVRQEDFAGGGIDTNGEGIATISSGLFKGTQIDLSNVTPAEWGGGGAAPITVGTDTDAVAGLDIAYSGPFGGSGFKQLSMGQNVTVQVGGVAADDSAARDAGTLAVFNNTLDAGSGAVSQGVSGVEMSNAAAGTVVFGQNTDGQGRIYVKFLDNNSYELYKDSSLSEESKVATGIDGEEIKEFNNSGLGGFTLHLAGNDLAGKKGVYIALAGVEGLSTVDGNNGVKYNGSVVGTDTSGNNYVGQALFDAEKTLFTGIELGKNTSEDGQIYFKNVFNADDGTIQVFAYKHKDMKAEDLVAQSTTYDAQGAGSMTVVLNEVRNADNTAGTGLGIILSVDGDAFQGQTKSTTLKGDVTFTNLGARLHSQDYGEDNYIKITQDKGAIFTYYGSPGDNKSATLLDAGEDGKVIQQNGQNATLSVNGMQVKTNGLRLKMATQDIQADLTFNQGKVGSTTLAQVGYGDGSIFTKIGALNLGGDTALTAAESAKYEHLSGLLANAGHTTNEKVNDFQGGMQLQLGEGAGDQDRTVVAIKSLTSENLGRVSKGGYWETGSSVYTERTFTMKDVMGGGLASLSARPTLAMSIIDKAISDVSETRAQIGAVQSNLLQTNSNNLSVTIENITKTESGIRDADMADEMTEFTKQQVLQNAAMSMMTQANQASQNVLQLLR